MRASGIMEAKLPGTAPRRKTVTPEEGTLQPFVLLDGGGHIKDYMRAASEKSAREAFLRRRRGKAFPPGWVVVNRERLRKPKNAGSDDPLSSSPQAKQKLEALIRHVEKVQKSSEELLEVLRAIQLPSL